MERLKALTFRLRISRVARQIRSGGLTYLSYEKLWRLERSLAVVNRQEVPGLIVEAGVARGGSALVLATQMGPGRRFRGYDVFDTIPAPTTKDGARALDRYHEIRTGQAEGPGGRTYYGYLDDLYNRVVADFQQAGVPVDGERVTFFRGPFQETFRFAEDDRVALAHLDCDWYEPIALCLNRLGPVLSPGALVIVDDYYDYAGCRRAVDAFLAEADDVVIADDGPNVVLRKRARRPAT